MAYNTKYRTEFKDTYNNHYIINFNKKDYTGDVIDLIPAPETLNIEYSGNDIYEPVKSAGCTINVYSSTDRQLIDLYTADYKGWKVEVLKNDDIYFQGYIEAELFNETFSELNNYVVSVQCNNGLGILSREKYIKDDESEYNGISSIFEVVKNCLDKTELDFNKINIATDININDTSIDSDKSILQYLNVNNDNYIDEDDTIMYCKEVLKSVLTPLNLSLFIDNDNIWIVDFNYLKNEDISYKSFNYGETVCTNHSINVVKDLNDVIQLGSDYDIVAGVNNYIVTKNRYVKNVIKEQDFSKKESNDANVWELKDESIIDTDYIGTDRKLWIKKIFDKSPDNYYIDDGNVINVGDTIYFDTYNYSAFFGGMKEQKIVDDELIDYDEDGNNFKNYIFISSPYRDYFNSEEIEEDTDVGTTIYYLAYNNFDSIYDNIDELMIQYTNNNVRINKSDNVILQLNFTTQILSTGVLFNAGYDYNKWNVDKDVDNNYGIFLIYTKIQFLDETGDVKYFLKLRNSENFNKDSEIPYPENAIYDLVKYTGQSFDYCYLYISDINEANNQVNVLNRDIEVNVDIPLNFDEPLFFNFEIYNRFFQATDKNDHTSTVEDYLVPFANFKESFPHIGFRNIYTKLIDKYSGEEIELNDSELQYYLSEKYKTKEIKDEFKHYTANNEYVTDVAGITLDNNYITNVNNSEYNETNLEDFKAEKVINQYSKNNINLNMNIQDDNFSLMNICKLNNDPIWSEKKWFISSLNNDVANNNIELKLKEIY